MSGRSNGLSQKIEVRAQAVGGGRLALPEDRLESTARDDAGTLLHELAKELQAGRVELDVTAFALDAKRFEVKRERARSEAPRRIRAASAQQGLDAGGELAKREGLDQIVVCAAREPLDAVVDRVARREHEYRRGEARGAKPSGERHAVGVGQPHVEDDEVEGRAVDALEGLEPRGGRLGRPAVLHGKEVADVGKDVGIVVDDENADAHESASFLISLPAGMLRLAACARHCAALDRLSVRSHLGCRVVDCTPSMPSTVE